MNENTENEPQSPRRVFIRFKTLGAPSDEDIVKAFYRCEGLTEDECYMRYEAREYEYSVIVVDIHGLDIEVADKMDLPHEVLKMTQYGNEMYV